MRILLRLIAVSVLVCGASAADWPELRGPNRDGTSPETGLPDTPAGDNLVWRAPFGGASGPVVLDDRIYMQNVVAEGAALQERLVSLDANTGKLVWEKRFNITHSHVSAEGAGRATPALDPKTGHVYVFTAGGVLAAFTRAGVPLWIRDLVEEFGLVMTDSATVVSPLVDGPLVIVSGITAGWGETAARAHRFLAFDTRTGENAWISASGRRPDESNFSSSPPLVTDVDGVRLLVAGGADGAWHAMKISTGEPVWRYEVSKRGLSLGAIRVGQDLVLTHAEERPDASPTGVMAIALLNPALEGEVTSRQTKWVRSEAVVGSSLPVSSPVSDGQRIYQIDAGGTLTAVEAGTGRRAWSLGTVRLRVARGTTPALADGKLYIGTQDGRFVVLRPRADGCDTVSETPLGGSNNPEPVAAGPAVANGRVYVASSKAVYAIGAKASRAPAWVNPPPPPPQAVSAESSPPASLQVIPADVALAPGQSVSFRVRLFDAKGRLIREEGPPQPIQQSLTGRGQLQASQPERKSDLQWSLDSLRGVIQPDGGYTAPTDATAHVGKVRVRLGTLNAESRVRVMPQQWHSTFDEFPIGVVPPWWSSARDTFAVKQIDGNNVLIRLAGESISLDRRVCAFGGLHTSTNYTIETDVRFAGARALGDGGVAAQGYELVASGSRQRLDLFSWQPEGSRTKTTAMALKADAWYRLKLRVELLLDGSVRARGKAWPAGDSEPDAWTLERQDAAGLGQLIGSPGLSGGGLSEVYFDNVTIGSNR